MQLRKILSAAAKVAISVVLIGFLVIRASRDQQFGALVTGEKNWPLLFCALPFCLAAVTITILRWGLLIHALGLAFTIRETLRAGYIGYLANLLPFGLVAGDSLKAIMLIHRNLRRKTEAVASVFVDRIIGLYALLLLAALASWFLPAEKLSLLSSDDRLTIVRLCYTVQTATILSTLGLVVMLIPAVTQSRLWDVLEHAPAVGPVLHKLVGAMRAYRKRVDLLLISIGISLIIHVCYVCAVALMTQSIGIAVQHRPPLASIFIIVPPSMIAGALPIGSFEVVFTLLFKAISPAGAPPTTGLLIALVYRVFQIVISTIGAVYWLAGRSEVRELMHEAETLPPVESLS